MKFIAIDIGSSYVKSGLMDLHDNTIVMEKKIPSPRKIKYEDLKLFVVPANEYVEIVKTLIDRYTLQHQDIQGVVFSTQMHGFVYKTANTKDTYVSWQDMRCLNNRPGTEESYMSYLQRIFDKQSMKQCGVWIKPSLGLCNLYAMLDSNLQIEKTGELFTIGSYIIRSLTGNNICHITNAAPLGLVDVIERKWDRTIIERAGFEEMHLPKIADYDFQECGVYEANGHSLKIYPDYGDQQIAILGSMAGKDDAVINIATSSQVSVTVPDFQYGDYEVRPYFENTYINTVSNMPSGRDLNVLIRFLRRAAEEITGRPVETTRVWDVIHKGFLSENNGIVVDTSFYARPGYLNGGAVSGILPENLTIHTLFTAAFQDMARMYWENIQRLKKKERIEGLVCAGGVSWKTPELLQIIECVSGKKCRLSAIPDESLSGLFRMALVCGGLCRTLADQPEKILKLPGR